MFQGNFTKHSKKHTLISRCYAKAKDVETDKYSAYIDCGEYIVQMRIIDCSKEIEIIDRVIVLRKDGDIYYEMPEGSVVLMI